MRSGLMTSVITIILFAVLPASAAETTGSIDGTISDGGKPVRDALVAAIPPKGWKPAAEVRSDAQGHFHFPSLPAAKYGVTATADGHTAGFTLEVPVVTGGTAHADVKLGGDAVTVAGTIVDDATGRALPDATLLAARDSDVEGDLFAVAVTDGKFRVLLPRAHYGLIAGATGHAEERHQILDSTTELTLRLTRAWPSGPAPAEVVTWLRTHAVPLATVEAGHGFDDLAPLAAAIGDARIVGLGEATHGTREFFQLKHRLLEWLVEKQGFNIFAIEATMPEAYDLNEYVLTGRGDPQKALAGLYFWTWDTEEVLALIRWMRHWNEDPQHTKVKFYGFDMQAAPRAAKVAFEYVARVAPTEAAALTGPLMVLRRALDAEAVGSVTPDEKQALKQAAQALVDRFDAAKADWSARSSPEQWAMARQHARILVQYLGELLRDFQAGGDWRDEAMAENIGWILEHEGPRSKMVVWAHNGHITHGIQDPMWHPMGQYLAHTWGKSYVNVGFAFDHGSFRARDSDGDSRLREFTVASLPAGSFDATLHATSLPRLVIDLRAAPAGIVHDWFSARHAMRDLGAVFSPKWRIEQAARPTVVPREFDLIAFIDETSAARGLPEGNGGDATVLPVPANLDFEAHDADKARDWKLPPQLAAFAWAVRSSTDHPFHGARCLLVSRLPGVAYGEKDGSFGERIDATAFRGKRVRLSGAVRAKVRGAGSSARLWLATELGMLPGSTTTMREHPIVDPRWRNYSVELDVPAAAGKLRFGGAVVGDGSACFDDFKLETMP